MAVQSPDLDLALMVPVGMQVGVLMMSIMTSGDAWDVADGHQETHATMLTESDVYCAAQHVSMLGTSKRCFMQSGEGLQHPGLENLREFFYPHGLRQIYKRGPYRQVSR